MKAIKRKKMTQATKIRQYMAKHPKAMPIEIAEALGVKIAYVNTIRWADKKKTRVKISASEVIAAQKKGIRIEEVTRKKMGLTATEARVAKRLGVDLKAYAEGKAELLKLNGGVMPKVGDSIGGLTLTRKALPDNTYAYRWVRDEHVKSGRVKVDDSVLPITMEEPKHDPVNHPAHYKVGGIETIDYIKAKLTPDEYRGYLKGNLLKYSSRIGHKGAAQVDAAKAGWYANALVQAIEPQAT